MGLMLYVKKGESILVGNVLITVTASGRSKARLEVCGPPEIPIKRLGTLPPPLEKPKESGK